MKRHIWIPLAMGIVAAYVILDRRATRGAAEYDDLETAANKTAEWGSKQRMVGTGRGLLGRVAGELGALLDKEFVAQDLPKLSPDRETASESMPEAV